MHNNRIIFIFAMMLSFAECAWSVDDKQIQNIEFTHTPVPSTAIEYASTYTKSKVIVNYRDGSSNSFPLSYHKLFGVKDKINGNPYAAGQLYSSDGSAIMDPFNKPVIAEAPDGNSLLNVAGKLYLVTHYEYDWLLSDGSQVRNKPNWYSRMPMGMTLTTLSQVGDQLKAVSQRPIDFSTVGGLYIPCFASQTPWNTHLGSEENYDIDARRVELKKDRSLAGMNALYFKSKKTANPYHYGVIPEVTVHKDGRTTVVKHHAMGRATWEMGKVMGDERTVYLGSDGTNQPLIMFVAKNKQDLSEGSIYAAKWKQTSASKGGSATLSWIKLGTSTNKKIKKLAGNIQFSDMFAWSGKPKSGYQAILANGNKVEYLKLNKKQETAAAFLETIRYAALRGATTEFNKMEGVAVNEKDKKVYIAMSRIRKGMLKTINTPADDIDLDEIKAGAVYELAVSTGQKDTDGNLINSDYVATTMQALVVGKDISQDEAGNTASVDRIANPDNIFFSEKMRVLFIGEDSNYHVNNFLWAYHVDTGKLARILSAVAGSEVTGLQVVENINGHSYIMSNAQHQGDFINTMDLGLKEKIAPMIDRFDAPVGYLSGLPSF